MKFAIIVNQAPSRRAGGETALRFCRQAVQEGHEICELLFYADGVYQAVESAASDPGDRDLAQDWLEFSRDANVPLNLCSAAVERRLGSNECVADGYAVVGLGAAMDRVLAADRVVTFGSLVS